MDKIIIASKINSILRCVNRIKTRLPASQNEFFSDLDAQDVIVLNLTRAVQLSVDIAMHFCASLECKMPQTMGQSFEILAEMGIINQEIAIKMKKSVGFRNIAVHSYDEIDLTLAFVIASEHILDFVDYINQIQTK